MSDFEGKLEQILNDPQAMEQIMSLARSLGGGGPARPSPSPERDASPAPPQADTAEAARPAGLLDGLGQLDPRLLTGAAQLLGQYRSNDDQRAALLNALRPFVKEKRYARLDKAIQIAKLSRLIRMALELFRAREDDNV